MLASWSAGHSALCATDHCKILVDGGLSARQVVLRLEQCGVTPEQLDGVVLTHEHTDHICGLEVLCHKFDLPIYCNRLTAEALRSSGLSERCRNWRLFATGAGVSICDITVQTFPLPHDAVDPLGFVFHARPGGLGRSTDRGFAVQEIAAGARVRDSGTVHADHVEKLLQDLKRSTWPLTQRLQARHGNLSNTPAAGVIQELPPGKIERVVLRHIS